MASLSPLLFVFDDDEIILLRGDIARSDPSTSIQDHSQTDSNDNTVSISDTDSNDNDNTLANSNDNALSSSNDYYLSNFTASNPTAMPPCRPTTPPAPPPKLPPSMGNANFNSNRSAAEYSRSVLFPERYGLPPSCDTESLFESPAPATMSRDAQTVPRSVPRESLEFEALHSEFMGLIQLSGPLPEEASEEESYHHPFAAAPQSPESMAIQPERDTYHDDDDDDAWSEMPPPSDVPSDVEPDTPNVTEPLHIRKRSSAKKRMQRNKDRGRNSQYERATRTMRMPHLRPQRIPSQNKSPLSTEPGFGSAGSTRAAALPRHPAQVEVHPYAYSSGHAAEEAQGHDMHASDDDAYLSDSHSAHAYDNERAPSPSPPLIRTPDTPPVATLPEPGLNGFFPKGPTGNIHARREAQRMSLALRGRGHGGGSGNGGRKVSRPDSQESEYTHGVGWPSRLTPAIVIPPLEMPIPPIALGPLPRLPGPDSGPAVPKSAPTFSTTLATTSPPPPPSPLSPSALSPPLTGNYSDNPSPRSISGFSINRPNGRRPASMQPQPSPREFVAGPLSRARDAALASTTHLAEPGSSVGSPVSLNRPTSAVSYHFGPITIPGSSPVVQAFEDIGAMGIIGPTSPFTQPRPAPRAPSALASYFQFPPPPGFDGNNANTNVAPPVTPTHSTFGAISTPAPTPTSAPAAAGQGSGSGEAIPPKARALLGLYSASAEVASPPAKKSKFGTKMSGLVRGVGARNTENDPQRSPEAVVRGKGLLSRRRNSMTVGKDAKEREEKEPPPVPRKMPSPGEERRVAGDSASVREWNNPDNFAPLTGYASANAHGSMSRLGLGLGTPPERERDRERGYERHRGDRDAPVRHGHKASFGSNHSFPASVVAESTYPSSVLSAKSSFEYPRSSPKVFASPKPGACSYKSSVDGITLAIVTANATQHKPKHSVEGKGIPNLTPHSKAGLYAPPPSDKWLKPGSQYHAPSLSPIVYSPPKASKLPAPNYPLPPLPSEEPTASSRSARFAPDASPSPRKMELPGSSDSDSPAGGKLRRRPPPIKVQRSAGPRSASAKHSGGKLASTTSRTPPARHHAAASVATPATAPASTSFAEASPSHRATSSADRIPYARHVPTNLHLRPHPAGAAPGLSPGSGAGSGTGSGAGAGSALPLRARVSSRASLVEESYFEADTPSPKAQGHFQFPGLRKAVRGHWDNRI